MTILDMLTSMHKNNGFITKALEIIKDDFTNLVNDNYELTINEKGELMVKIPSLEKRDEFVYKDITEYQYPLVMCMRISESKNVERYNFMLGKFMELYKNKLELFFKDVNTVDILMEKIKKTKNNIDNVTYTLIVVMILGGLSLCIFPNMSQTVRFVFISATVLFPIVSLTMQFAKEGQVKNVIDGYISVIKTDWYRKELKKQYVFLCNFME
jgi:hypothetical protein